MSGPIPAKPRHATLTRVRHAWGTLAAGAMLVLAACSPAAPAASPTVAAPTAASKPTSAAPAAAATTGPAASPAPGGAAPAPAPSPAVLTSTGTASAPGVQPLAQRAPLKMSVSSNIVYLPIFVALEKGYFKQAGLDVEVTVIQGASTTVLPLLARGDLDLAGTTPAPALFNQLVEGFDIKVIASMGVEKPGRASAAWFVSPKGMGEDLKGYQDLRGKTIEAGSLGTPIDLMASEAARQGGLVPGKDVTIAYRLKNRADFLTMLQAKAADIIGIGDPLATQSAQQGFGTKWKSLGEVVPWYQPQLLAASAKSMSTSRPVLQKFLEVYLVASREVNSTNGTWTPDLTAIAAKNGGVDAGVIRELGGVGYYDPNGTVSEESIQRSQDFWAQTDQVKQKVDVKQVVDTGPLGDALKVVGSAS